MNADDSSLLDGSRITQADVTGGELTLKQIRQAGLKVFAKSFDRLDGYGDGPLNPDDTISPALERPD